MSIFSALAFGGTGLGPAIMGYVADNLGWRWIQWLETILAAVILVAMVFFTKETRGEYLNSLAPPAFTPLKIHSAEERKTDPPS